MHYSEYKNRYQGAVNLAGEKVKPGEYHSDTKCIDLMVPAGALEQLDDYELNLLKRDEPLPLSETQEQFDARKEAVLAKFE